MTAIVPLSSWYPTMYDQWVREGRRLWAGIAVRTGWTVHHTAGGAGQDARRYARWVASYHYGKWRRPGGYNFFIPEDGTILEMCSWDWIGAHARGANTSDIGVAFQGTFESRLPNRAQQAAFAALVGMGRVPNRQRGHRDVSSTSCPGRTLHLALPLSIQTDEEDDVYVAKFDERGGRVRRAQRVLVAAGRVRGVDLLPRFGADGHYGNETAGAVNQVARWMGREFPEDGGVGMDVLVLDWCRMVIESNRK